MSEKWIGEEIETGLRALVHTIAPARVLPAGAARVVQAIQDHFGTRLDVDTLRPIDDGELAARLSDPWLRQQLVRAAIVGVLIDGAPTRADVARIRSLATLLGIVEPGIEDLALFIAGRKWRLRRHLLARFWAIDRMKARIAERGFLRTVVPAILATVFKRYRNRALAARFATLRALPAGTLGRGFIDYLEANGFGLPGEIGAVSDIIVAHDLAHVLGDYQTSPGDEVQVASFSAGHRRNDPFAMVLFVMFQFHLGVRLTPGAAAEKGYFDPALVLAAIARGAAMSEDLTGDWDYWSLMAVPVETLRSRYGITRRRALAPATTGAAA